MRLAGLVLAVLAATAAPAQARADHGHPYWHQHVHVVTVNATGVPSVWGVRRAVRQWNAVRAGQPRLRLVTGRARVTIRVVHLPADPRTGINTPRHRGLRLTGSSVLLNESAIRQAKYRCHGTWWAVRRYTTSHELGHVLGLGHHQAVRSSVMSYATPWWVTQGVPSRYDAWLLRRVY